MGEYLPVTQHKIFFQIFVGLMFQREEESVVDCLLSGPRNLIERSKKIKKKSRSGSERLGCDSKKMNKLTGRGVLDQPG